MKPSEERGCGRCGIANGLQWRAVPTSADPNAGVLFHVDSAGNPIKAHRHLDGAGNELAPVPVSPVTAGNVPAISPVSGTATAPVAATAPSAGSTTVEGLREQKQRIERELAEAEELAARLAKEEAERIEREAREEEERINAERNTPIAESYSGDVTATESGRVPALNPDHVWNIAQRQTIEAIIAELDRTGTPVNVGFHGEPGSGKTTLAVQIAAMRGSPLYWEEAGTKQSADEWLSTLAGVDKTTGRAIVNATEFVKGIETPNSVVVINDVANLQTPSVQNGLNELLDPSTRQIYVPALERTVRVARGVMIILTWNTNTVSARAISGQLLDRFGSGTIFEVEYPSEKMLAKIIRSSTGIAAINAERLAACTMWLRNDQRPILISPRRLIAAAKLVINGLSIGHALAHTAFGELSAEQRARAYQIIDARCGEDDRGIWAVPVEEYATGSEYNTIMFVRSGAGASTDEA